MTASPPEELSEKESLAAMCEGTARVIEAHLAVAGFRSLRELMLAVYGCRTAARSLVDRLAPEAVDRAEAVVRATAIHGDESEVGDREHTELGPLELATGGGSST